MGRTALGVVYRGQRLAGIASEVFLHVLRAQRVALSSSRKEAILASQGGLCKE